MTTDVERLSSLLEHADMVLAAMPQDVAPLSAADFNRTAMLASRARLAADLQLARGEYLFELKFIGGSEHSHQAPLDFVAHISADIQAAVNHLVHVRMKGKEKTAGRFPTSTREASQLELAATAPGSFVLGLQGAPEAPGEEVAFAKLDDFGEHDFTDDELRRSNMVARDQALDLVIDAMAAAASDDEVALSEAVSEFGSAGAVERIADLVQRLGSTGTTCEVTHRPGNGLEVRTARLTPARSTSMAQRLHDVTTKQSEHTIDGQLSGIVWGTGGRFHLDVGTGPWPPVIKGSVAASLRDQVREMFDRPVTATLTRTVTASPGRSRTTWRLTSVTALDK